MNLKNNFKKFKKHFKAAGLSYALWRGINNPEESSIAVFFRDRIKLICSNHGIKVLWKNQEVTAGVGLNIAINTLGLWTDSTKADWGILEKKESYLRLRIVFRELPLSQIWILKINDRQEIDWQVDMDVEEWLYIDELRIVCLVDPCYKSWLSDYRQGDFPRPGDGWQEIHLNEQQVSMVGARFPVESGFLPAFALMAQSGKFLPLIQNPPANANAHVIGLRYIDSQVKNSCEPGYYNIFSGKINLFESDHLLDSRIECLRKDALEVTMKNRIKNKKQKLKVLLVNLPWQKDGKWGVRAGSRWPHIKDESEDGYLPFPFFLAYTASLLKKHDIDVSLIDAIAEQIPEDEFLGKILGMNFDYLVAETSVPSLYGDLNLLKKISQAGISIILCGPNSEIYKPEFLKEHSFINFVLYGEYEFTLLDLVQSLQKGKDLSRVKGLVYRDSQQAIKKNSVREHFDVNLLPWPLRDDLPMHKYLDAPGEMLTPSVQMLASRGCPYRCQFCLWPQVIYNGNHYRTRNVSDVIDEMEHLVREMGFKSVYFDDDTFNIGKERMLSFCREIIGRGLNKIQWAIMARPDLMDEQILENMKKAGLWAVKYGVESATQSLIDNIGKNMDLKRAERMIRLTKDLGIKVHLTFTFGLPGETKQSIEETIRYALRLNPFSAQFSITTPFPGTQYYEILDNQGFIVSKDFSCYDGHLKSVIKLENLTPRDLEVAKMRAYRIWADHSRRKRGFPGNVKRFIYYSANKDLGYGLYKTLDYFSYILLKRKKYLRYVDR